MRFSSGSCPCLFPLLQRSSRDIGREARRAWRVPAHGGGGNPAGPGPRSAAGALDVVAVAGARAAYFPAPFEWWSAAVRLWGSGQLLPAFAATVTTFLEGLVLAVTIG